MAHLYANMKNDLHGIVFKGRHAYAMRAWSDGTWARQANLPIC